MGCPPNEEEQCLDVMLLFSSDHCAANPDLQVECLQQIHSRMFRYRQSMIEGLRIRNNKNLEFGELFLQPLVRLHVDFLLFLENKVFLSQVVPIREFV